MTRWVACSALFFSSLTLAACGDALAPESASGPTELKIGFAGANVASSDIGVGQFATLLTLEGLTYAGVDGRPNPRLAESWRWENGGLSLRVKLRSGIKFHDGTPLTAAVAASALQAAIDKPDNRALYPSLTDVTAIRVEGEDQILIDVSQRAAFLPEELSIPLDHGPEHVGTGPYRVVTRQAAELVLERFEPYYLGKPSIRKVTVHQFDALRTAWSSLLRGDFDMVSDVPPDAVEFVRTERVQVISFARGYQYLIAFNSGRTPFQSAAVRRALNLAVNRDQLAANLFQGYAIPATGPLWPKHWAYDSTVKTSNFDPAAASALLDSAGFPPDRIAETATSGPARLRFTCLIAGAPVERLALEVQRQLYAIGVDMQFETLDPRALGARIRQGDFDAVLTDMISGPTLGRPYIFWRSAKESKGLNVFGYENAEAERLFQVLRSSTNEAAVRSATRRLQEVLLDDPPALFLAWSQRNRAVSRNFDVVAESGGDPLLSLGRWNPAPQARGTRASLYP